MKKTILITGSTDGIGKLAAIKLAREGHELYIHGRNRDKLEATLSEIKSISKLNNIKGFTADFSDMDSVQQMAEAIKMETSTIDVIINNAGIYKSASSQNEAGMDMRFAVNYLAPYLLTNALKPLLKKESRIINLSSAAQSSIEYDAFSGERQITDHNAYAQSKLALTIWSFYLAEKWEEVEVIAVNPGSLLKTKMVAEAFGDFWSPADKGAEILYDLAVSEAYKGSSGKYFDNDKGTFSKAHRDAYNGDEIERLITASDILLNKI